MTFKVVFTMSGVSQGSNWSAEMVFSSLLLSDVSSIPIDSGSANTNLYNGTTNPVVNITAPASVPVAMAIDKRISSINNDQIIRRISRYEGGDMSYVTWRDAGAVNSTAFNINTPQNHGQYPQAGLSFDIVQQISVAGNKLYNDVAGYWTQYNPTAKTYTLHPNKYTLIYNYDSAYPLIFSRGGTLSISSSNV